LTSKKRFRRHDSQRRGPITSYRRGYEYAEARCFMGFMDLNQMVLPKVYSSSSITKALKVTSAFAVFNCCPIPANTVLENHTPKRNQDLPGDQI
jgi:hypothetical protein